MKEKENSVEYGNDDTDSSYIVIDGVVFAAVGFDDTCGFDSEDWGNGGQERIHKSIKRVADSLGLEELK
jgi:hypothetical protein